MQLEVPKDQYSDAIKLMEDKIKDGKVPGISDPAKAKDLVRAGHLTYQQSVNITKFGTIESLAYDASKGIVVGVCAGGINMIFTTACVFWQTKDFKEAIRAGAAGAAMIAGKGFSIFMIGSQVQKIKAVKKFIDQAIRIKLSPQNARAIAQGLGRETGKLSTAAAQVKANRLLRGTVVTAVVAVSVTTAAELIKMARGKISQAQFIKNVVVSTSGIAGGTLGAVLGTTLLAPVPFIGPVIGGIIGGIVGGAVSSKAAKSAMDNLIEDDSVKMMEIITRQIEYFVVNFVLTSTEMDSLNQSLDEIIDKRTTEEMMQSGNYRAYAASIIKPIVVEIVSSRPKVNVFTSKDIEDAIYEVVA